MAWTTKVDGADRAFSVWVRLRDRKCRRCGSAVRFNDKGLPVSHQASHFQGRRKEATRFEESNVMCLCGGCHQYLGSHPGEHYEFQVKELGQAKVDEVILQSNSYHKKDRVAERLYWRHRVLQDYGLKI